MSDPPYLGDNRYAALAEGPQAKKKRSIQNVLQIFPELPVIQKPDPKYVILSAIGDKNIQEYSCFLVHRSLKSVCPDILSVSELRDGNLLLLTGNKKNADKLISTKVLPGVCNIKCEYHSKLNSSKGTIYAPYLNNVPEDEIVSELKSQGVSEVYKYQKKNSDEKLVPCGVLLLTFDRYSTPEKLDISWHKVKVRPYYPNPMRCKSCQRLGHTKKWCKNNPLCEKCALPPHTPTECTRTFCVNCSEEHPSNFKECKVFKQHKEVLKIKTKEKCSLKAAKEKYETQTTTPPLVQTFSDVITNKNINNTVNCNIKPTKNNILSEQNSNPNNNTTKILSVPNNRPEISNNNNNVPIGTPKKNTQETKLLKPTTSNKNSKTLPSMITRSMTKQTTNSQTITKPTKTKEILNFTQNNNLDIPKQSTHNSSYNVQEEIMFVDEE